MTATQETTQVKRPLRATLRTTVAATAGFLPVLPYIAEEFHLVEALPWMAGVLATAAAITRIMATATVEDWLRRFFPLLAADVYDDPAPKHRKKDDHEPQP